MTDRVSRGSRWSVIAGFLIGSATFAASAAETPREAAVAVARGGDAERSLVLLQALQRHDPADTQLLADTIVVANWAGRDDTAVELASRHSTQDLSVDALETAARSARNRRAYAQAAHWFDAAFARDPRRLGAAAGAAMSLAEAGETVAANTRADAWADDNAAPFELVIAAAYVRRRSARPMDALVLYQRAQALRPDSAEATDGVRTLLADLGAAQAAQAQPGATAAEREQLSTDRVAQAIRWAEYTPEDPQDRRAEARAALAAADANLAALPAGNTVQRRRARMDRVVALRQLDLMEEAVEAAQALRDEGVELPAYVQIALADALLYLQKPKQAIALYQSALAAEPRQTEVEFSLMYAQLEAEDFGAARDTLDATIKHSPPWTRTPGLAHPLPNDQRARADINVALLQSFGDDLDAAQRRLEELVAEAPARAELHRELATIYLRRGWPERALQRYRIASSLQRQSIALRLDMLAAERRLGRFDAIEEPLRALEAEPEAATNRHVQRFREDWDAQRGWQLDLGARRGRGDSTVFGNRDSDDEASLATPLFANFWRVAVHHRQQRAEIPEGDVSYRRNGLGLRYSRERLDLRVAWFEPYDGFSDRAALETSLRWEPADRWWVGAQTSTASTDTPLRARWYGITGRSLGLAGGFERDEVGDITVHLTRMDLTDGNRRESLGAALREQVLTRPHFKLDLHGELGTSRNSLSGVPYFNPSRDAIALAGIAADWMNWRHYGNRFQQRASLWLGSYWQQGYGSSEVVRLNYEHEWQFGPSWMLRYGLGWYLQSYDGRRETRREIFLALHWGGLP